MDINYHKYKYDRFAIENLTSRIVIVALIGLIIWQQKIISDRITDQRTVFMPPKIVSKSFWVTGDTLSAGYLENVSQFVIFNLFNVTPHNAKDNSQNVLALVEPEFYKEVEEVLDRQINYLVDNQISRTFYYTSINARTPGEMMVTGIIKDMISDKVVSRYDVDVKIGYAVKHGRFMLTSIEVVNKRGGKR
jgi:conjugal transfer pilus assembly protein TraE